MIRSIIDCVRAIGRSTSRKRLIAVLSLWTVIHVIPTQAATFPTADQLFVISPRADPLLVAALIEGQSRIKSAGINTNDRTTHFLAQILTETGGLRRLDENMKYSPERLVVVFAISPDVAKQIAGDEKATANYVYGARLGNTGRHTDDGWRYRGSGYIQLTGRLNFRNRGIEINRPFEEQPDLVRQPKDGLDAALAYWTARKINFAADTGKVSAVRRLINPAGEGTGAARLWYRRVSFVLTGTAAELGSPLGGESESPNSDDVGIVLRELGFLSKSNTEAASADELTDALKAFQSSRSLPATGKVDTETLYELTDPLDWKKAGGNLAPLNNINPNRHAGVTYDLGTGKASLAKATSSEQSLTGTSAKVGSGAPQEKSTLTNSEAMALKAASPSFAPYEENTGARKTDGTFVPFSVILPDTREAVSPTTQLPSSSVVQITFLNKIQGKRFACTGTMISENVVLTAGHCVHDGGASGAWHEDFAIIPARNAMAKPYGVCGATKLYSVTGWVESETPDEGKYYDLGAIRLDCNVGMMTGWLAMEPLADGKSPVPATLYGYPCDKTPEGKQWKSTGEIELMTESKLFYKNDTFGCMSGSAVLVDGNRVVGVHTNGLFGDEPWSSFNAGTRLSKDIVANLAAWMKE